MKAQVGGSAAWNPLLTDSFTHFTQHSWTLMCTPTPSRRPSRSHVSVTLSRDFHNPGHSCPLLLGATASCLASFSDCWSSESETKSSTFYASVEKGEPHKEWDGQPLLSDWSLHKQFFHRASLHLSKHLLTHSGARGFQEVRLAVDPG